MGLINIYRNSIQVVKTELESFGTFSAINPEIWEKNEITSYILSNHKGLR